MNLTYRKITKSELPQAVELTLRVFDEFEAPEYPAEGVQTFHNIMADEPFLNQICIYGAFDESAQSTRTAESTGTVVATKSTSTSNSAGTISNSAKLVGIIATRNNGNHITLFFVDKNYHRKRIGRQLFELVKADNTTGTLTVNSSPYAVEVYKHLGFTPTGPEELKDGIRSTPMEFKIAD